MLQIRVDADLKSRIEKAAHQRGQSVSAFVLSAAKAAAQRVKPLPVTRKRGGGAPTFIVAACDTAKNGGPSGYSAVGYELARHAANLGPHDVDDDRWADLVDDLAKRLRAGEVRSIVRWLREHLPECLALIPAKRHAQAARGAIECYVDGKMN